MKKLIGIILAITIVFTLTACGSNGDTSKTTAPGTGDNASVQDADKNGSGETASPDDSAFDYYDKYIDEHLKGDYSITYKMTFFEPDTEPESYNTTIMRTKDGYFANMGEDSYMLFLKNGEKYDAYMGGSIDDMTLIPEVSYTEDEVKAQTQILLGYMSAYTAFEDQLKKEGSSTVAGRDCEKYTVEATTLGYKAMLEYHIDKETGVCLKYNIVSSSLGQEGGYLYECSEFKTSDITLPSHK